MHQSSFVPIASGVEKWSRSLALIRREFARSNRAPRTATSSKDRTPPCRGVRCEFESRRSRQFRRRTLGWFGGCSFKALIHGFDSRHRRQDCDSCFLRILEALMLGTMKLEIIARWLLTCEVDPG